MDYVVAFVGLTGFTRVSPTEVLALQPDGRYPPPDISPHLASISVFDRHLVNHQGWYDSEVTRWTTLDGPATQFMFSASTFAFPVDKNASPLTEQNFGNLPDLAAIDPRFSPGENTNWISKTSINAGSLIAHKWTGYAPDDPRAPYLTEWLVPYDGTNVRIEVTARKGWPTRTIELQPFVNSAGNPERIEITMLNTSRGAAMATDLGDHFQIYAELSTVPVDLRKRPTVSVDGVASTLRVPIFLSPAPAQLENGCSGATMPPLGPTKT